jgi:hypothetical protein
MTRAVAYTIFRDAHDNRGREFCSPWNKLTERLVRHEEGAKDGTAITCGTFAPGSTRGRASLMTRNLVALDVEAPKGSTGQPPPPTEAAARLEKLGLTGIVWTTHSHTETASRYRVLVPLSEPIQIISDEMRRADGCVPRLLARALDLAEVTDFTKLGSESLFFLPRHPVGAAHWSVFVEGKPLAMGATLEQALNMANVLAAAQQSVDCGVHGVRHSGKSWPALLEKHRGLGPNFSVKHGIDGWNLANQLSDVLVRHGYVCAGGNRWRSPLQATTSEAAVSLRRFNDGREWWISFSASDDAAGIGAPAQPDRPYTRFGEAFDIEVYFGFDRNYRGAAARLLGHPHDQ